MNSYRMSYKWSCSSRCPKSVEISDAGQRDYLKDIRILTCFDRSYRLSLMT